MDEGNGILFKASFRCVLIAVAVRCPNLGRCRQASAEVNVCLNDARHMVYGNIHITAWNVAQMVRV